ncbi:structure-specific endonuclease subunit SLX1, partial [Lecanoromycetidae sp. Uapishka_2]
MERRPIPAFYCCYLLRSQANHSSVYVGSTPNPRITAGRTKVKTSSKTGRKVKQFVAPRPSLTDKLSNLHLLLRVPSFAKWPLQVRFLCEDVYQMWQRWSERVDSEIREGIKIYLDVTQSLEANVNGQAQTSVQAKGKRKGEAIGKGGIDGLDIGYGDLKAHLEKSTFLLGEDEKIRCAVCSKTIGPSTTMALVCPRDSCKTATHMICLATRFLSAEDVRDPVLPTSGRCPDCKEELQWIDLLKEMSLRANGDKEVSRLMEKPKERKLKVSKSSKAKSSQVQEDKLKDESEDQKDDLAEDTPHDRAAADDALPDDWYYQGDEDNDVASTTEQIRGLRMT